MKLWREVKEIFSEDAGLAELLDPGRAGSRLRKLLLLCRETARSIRRDDALNLSAALAFKSLLALVPLLAISLAVVAWLGESSPESQGQSLSYTQNFIQVVRERIPEFDGMNELFDSIRGFAGNAVAIGGIGFILLFYTAYSLLISVETAFNQIWKVREKRAFLGRLSAFLSTLIIVPILMSLSVYLTARIASAADDLQGRLAFSTAAPHDAEKPDSAEIADSASAEAAAPVAAQAPILNQTGAQPGETRQSDHAVAAKGNPVFRNFALGLTSLITTCLAMTALYYLLPFTPVRLKAALAGGVFTGAFFELAMRLFRYYAANCVTNYTKIYGPLLAIPLFLLWVQLVWVMVLVGAELAFAAQNFRNLAARAALEKRGIANRLYLALRIVLAVGSYHRRGLKPEGLVEELAANLLAPPYLVRELLLQLAQRGILRRVEPGAEEAYLPGRDISSLTALDVVRAVSSDRLDVPNAPDDTERKLLSSLFGRVLAAEREALGACTIAQLVEAAGGGKTGS